MIRKIIKLTKLLLSSFFFLLGSFLVGYDIYWLVTRADNYSGGFLSGLSKGIAVVNIFIGLIFLLLGFFLLKLKKK